MAPRSSAASRTERAIGPAVSWVSEIGTMPARLTSPTVGLMPTMPFAVDGQDDEGDGDNATNLIHLAAPNQVTIILISAHSGA